MIKLGKLDNELILKVIRHFILVLAFLCMSTVMGLDLRSAHQLIFSLATIVLFMFLVDNIWLTLFMWWTIFLYAYYGCNFGDLYITNIFYGAIIYYLVKLSYRKKHIDFFLDGILWLCFLNIAYQIVQVTGNDFLYTAGGTPTGFMGNRGITTIFFALCIPILARRNMWLALLLFIPAKAAGGSMGLVACLVGYLWMLFFKVKHLHFVAIALLLIVGSVFYAKTHTVDRGLKERISVWKPALQDASAKPIVGWGLDSFRNFTEKKNHMYLMDSRNGAGYKPSQWDNPHNLYISIFFEWGLLGIIFLLGYIRQCGIQFTKALKTPNLYALSGVLIVFFVASAGWFPMFLARCAVIFVPLFALYEVEARV